MAKLARLYERAGQREKTIELHERRRNLEPENVEFLRASAGAYKNGQRIDRAIETLKELLEKDKNRARSHYHELLDIYLASDSKDPAIATAEKIVTLAPSDAEARLDLAQVYSLYQETEKTSAYEEMSAIYKEAGQSAKAVETLESALHLVPDKAPVLRSLIRLAHEAENFPKVLAYFEQLIAMSGKPSLAEYERLGKIYMQTGEPEKAKQAWNKILDEAPKDAKAIDRLATILRNEGFDEEAIAVKSKAVELDPANAKARFEYAQMLAAAEQPTQALEQLQTLLDLGERQEIEKAQPSPAQRSKCGE